MVSFADALHIGKGITAVIGGGGKTSLIERLADELSARGSVIVTTTTHIYRPAHLPFSLRATGRDRILCVGTPCADGKLTAPAQSFEELASLADYVLTEADGSKRLPLKAHEAHEPVIPPGAQEVIAVVGASGLYRPICEAAHRPQRYAFLAETDVAAPAEPRFAARVLEKEALHTRVFINQTDVAETAARELAALLHTPVVPGSVQRGEILSCLFSSAVRGI